MKMFVDVCRNAKFNQLIPVSWGGSKKIIITLADLEIIFIPTRPYRPVTFTVQMGFIQIIIYVLLSPK